MNIRIRIAVVLKQDDKVLMVQHKKNGKKYWLLPGGGLEFGETIEHCAKRELMEETNLDIDIGELLFINESIPPDNHRQVLNLYYSATLRNGTLRIGNDIALNDVKFVDISNINNLTVYPNIRKELLDYLSGRDISKISLGNKWE